jgi:site-specific recombinase XerD
VSVELATATLAGRADHAAASQRQSARTGPADACPADQVMELLPRLPVWQDWDARRRAQARRGAAAILGWLAAFPGAGWQQRWQGAGAGAGLDWLHAVPLGGRQPASPVGQRETSRNGLAGLLLCRAVLPSYQTLAGYQAQTLFAGARRVIQPDTFAKITSHAAAAGMPPHLAHAGLTVITKLALHTGRDVTKLSFDDFEEYRAWGRQRYGTSPPAILPAWDLLRGIGAAPATLSYRAMLARDRQRPTAELVDRYQIRCAPARDALIRYLDERRPGMDYKSFLNLIAMLAGLFWADIEAHHPGISSLHLPADVAAAWKQRLQHCTGRDGQRRPRKEYLPVLMQVRSFYLDIQEWAVQDPTWAAHAVPSPVRRGETAGWAKQQRRASAAMHQRIRERLPQLPVLVEAAESRRVSQQALLAAATATPPGEAFEHDGTRYRRTRLKTHAKPRSCGPPGAVLAADIATGQVTDVTQAEDEAFWAWAIIETLRHTGVRLEELLEISHLALTSYQLPDTGELVPLLQILPSKNDQERLLLISPELASVLATIISRPRAANGGTIPLVSQYDRLERGFKPALPLLFQRKTGHRSEAISVTTVQELLNSALARAGLRDRTGEPLRFTPHDFRRMFATDAVTGGLPVHIAARLPGHASIATTETYLAVFQDELISTYRAFLDQRRALRPQAEYREPTSEEWREFQQHFALRKAGLGTCGRPYGTPCKHEHACVRCPMLRIDPAQRSRLADITRNLAERIGEARSNGWPGEAQGLQVSLHAAQAKLAALDRMQNSTTAAITDPGIPQISPS